MRDCASSSHAAHPCGWRSMATSWWTGSALTTSAWGGLVDDPLSGDGARQVVATWRIGDLG